ncbi:MAG: DUF4426 domain-containing protein [Gammaproteobacteria bacterium]|nr:DUF4426 domain-containing protein [Gammaproteobacteria bacterium]MBU2056632.1 DUF4426 domain-containing protein [Gammaproteobacteria bacterium]MBU2173969.1 DUF4426 domain-containing protein [Gammaproteobacteria bacterium]MBU2247275.1 DUF4426 domain-containing protein [Gammaproteobacteria bacterium]MBU2344933.1 DUF4426 domain-containing protein [Gammaproteobacteria bacterium]
MKIYLMAASLVLALFLSPLQAEQKKVLGPWDVHYIAFDSTMIDAKIAQSYQLQRSKYQAVLNISVLNSKDQKAQQVRISGTATDLTQKQIELSFREVKEGDAIYYLAQVPVHDQKHLKFKLDIWQGTQNQKLEFSQVFYTE